MSLHKATFSGSLTQQIYQLIADRKVQPGDSLPSQIDLARQFGVSRPAIREALSRLEAVGLIKIEHGRSTRIQQVDLDSVFDTMSALIELTDSNVLELLEAKEIVETKCAELAARRATKEELQEIEKYLAIMQKSFSNPRKHALADYMFHFSIVKAAHNPIVVDFMKIVGKLLFKAIEQTAIYDDIEGRNEAFYYHTEIYNAICARRGGRAKSLLHAHSIKSRERYRNSQEQPNDRRRSSAMSLKDLGARLS